MGGGGGDGLGSAAPTRQLNAPWTWWISNWSLITSKVRWIRVLLMNGRRGPWQISVVTPLRELWVEGRQMWACLIQHTGPACYMRVCVLILRLNNMCVDTVKTGLWHVKNSREGNWANPGRNVVEKEERRRATEITEGLHGCRSTTFAALGQTFSRIFMTNISINSCHIKCFFFF